MGNSIYFENAILKNKKDLKVNRKCIIAQGNIKQGATLIY